MWSTLVIELQAHYSSIERLAEVAVARRSDEARRIADCAETERRAHRNAPAPLGPRPVAWSGK